MGLPGKDIRSLRQRLGWSLAEMARQMGCSITLIETWEEGREIPDSEALNHLRYLQNHVDSYNDRIAQKPLAEKEMESRGIDQLTHRDLLKDN